MKSVTSHDMMWPIGVSMPSATAADLITINLTDSSRKMRRNKRRHKINLLETNTVAVSVSL
jgi:hypothetical protein